jgi:carotenoid cleavage dioxygenase
VAAGDLRLLSNPVSPNAANTNIVWHAGRLLALWEGGPPHALDPRTLETEGPHDFAGRLAGAMTAHPKLDPESGEMLFFGYGFAPPFLRYHVVDASGRLVRSEEIEVPVPDDARLHDLQRHVIFMVCPATVRPRTSRRPARRSAGSPLRHTIGVMPREAGARTCGGSRPIPAHVFHPLNAREDGGRIVADVCRYEAAALRRRTGGGGSMSSPHGSRAGRSISPAAR